MSLPKITIVVPAILMDSPSNCKHWHSYIRQVRWLLLYLFLTAFPYFVSAQTQIWHLIPVAAPASLLIPLVIYHLFRAAAKYHPQTLPLVNRATLFIVAAISLLIWRDLSKEHYSGISFRSEEHTSELQSQSNL